MSTAIDDPSRAKVVNGRMLRPLRSAFSLRDVKDLLQECPPCVHVLEVAESEEASRVRLGVSNRSDALVISVTPFRGFVHFNEAWTFVRQRGSRFLCADTCPQELCSHVVSAQLIQSAMHAEQTSELKRVADSLTTTQVSQQAMRQQRALPLPTYPVRTLPEDYRFDQKPSAPSRTTGLPHCQTDRCARENFICECKCTCGLIYLAPERACTVSFFMVVIL